MAEEKFSTQIPEVVRLREETEQKYGRAVRTSTDFELLSIVIERETGEYISASTLKRMWGYVSSHPLPRIATLDILARFVGKDSFQSYREHLLKDPAFESAFFTTRFISAESLSPEDVVTIGWSPNRLVSLRYLGDSRFQVVKSENARLLAGDVFSVSQFMLGQPIILDRILRDGAYTPSYVAGKKNGINYLEVNQTAR